LCSPRLARASKVPTLGDVNKPGTAAVLSFIVPGVGQIYNGNFWRGIFWLIITPGFWLGTGGLLGWICHLISAYTAYKRAEKQEFRALPFRV
jgi:TM2 domain-containing membrane protein YozV